MDSQFITSAAKPEQFPKWDRPEIAFIGRSNAGKSSLLNALINRKNLARTGSTPGVTQLVNFFEVQTPASFVLVDLPGYGFRQAPKDVSQNWEYTIKCYLERQNILHFVFLADLRRGLDEDDLNLLRWIAAKRPPCIVFTKADKLKTGEQKKQLDAVTKTLIQQHIEAEYLSAVSSLNKQGLETLSQFLFQSPG